VLNYINVVLGVVVIPKTEKIERLKENFFIYDFKLEEQDINDIRKLDSGIRTIDPK